MTSGDMPQPPPTSSASVPLMERELLQALTAAVKELSYSINTMVISSLANDDSRARVLARIERKA
jgi:hypothetical protein